MTRAVGARSLDEAGEAFSGPGALEQAEREANRATSSEIAKWHLAKGSDDSEPVITASGWLASCIGTKLGTRSMEEMARKCLSGRSWFQSHRKK